MEKAQLLTYMKLAGVKTGLLINFFFMPFVSFVVN